MTYKIIFTDIDGTLLNKERQLSPLTLKVFQQLKEDLPVVLISSRMPQAMEHLQKELNIAHQPLICYNGALISINGKTVVSKEIPWEIVNDLHNFNFNLDLNCHISLYNNRDWYVPKMDEWAKREKNNTKVTPQIKSNRAVLKDWKNTQKGAHKIMCMGEGDKIDAIEDHLFKDYKDRLHLYRSKDTYLEITYKEVSKLTAVKYLLDSHFSFSLKETIAFGDNYNDFEMLKAAGMGIAVGNARPEILKIAKQVTKDNTEDGVAKSLQQLFNLAEF
ncbi:Cof-type HAD-IIB family hydrolase [Salinimicrobium terrae]|uniref:Cof-type HAD-IIB family hydrolase n=1 Tax=Salinimicrobium terrae TaxID=470866 RepID=UPI0003FAFA68|nr:Cof-type HAD-IIB family hydrolase [Salinimicrobium terrae]